LVSYLLTTIFFILFVRANAVINLQALARPRPRQREKYPKIQGNLRTK